MSTRWGQNFLIDSAIAVRIVEAAAITSEDTVIEIGPGKGALTSLILPHVKKLIAVEIDPVLARKLQERFANQNNLEVANQDVMEYALPATAGDVKIIANLPYYISTAIIEKICLSDHWSTAVLMVQKEVGDRIAAYRNTGDYGYFSLLCQYYAETQSVLTVKPQSFLPPPKVDSVVVKLTNKHLPPPDPFIFTVIKAAFSQRRKTILNALSNVLDLPKGIVIAALTSAGISPTLRAENLTFADFSAIAGKVKQSN
jgi:16S rRNA (adenine1518-N6/adenine1519-N6)-dimethyltransferase